MRIPEIRERLSEIAGIIAELAREQIELTEQMRRRPAIRRSARKLPAITAEDREVVRAIADARTGYSYIEIARSYHHVTGKVINTGRVSEILAGHRD